jgi:hypothetical protein
MGIKGQTVGHALVAFPTLDKGVVYVDVTPSVDAKGNSQFKKRFVWVRDGDPYHSMVIEKHGIDFKNELSFFEKARDIFASRDDALKAYAIELKNYNNEIERINIDIKKLNDEVLQFNKSRRKENKDYLKLKSRLDEFRQSKKNWNLNLARLNEEAKRINEFSEQAEGVFIGDWITESPQIVFPLIEPK